MKRSDFLVGGASIPMLTPHLALAAPGAVVGAKVPVTGKAIAQLQSFDRFMLTFMKRFSIPGGQCAVARNGRLVYARGFGYADQLLTTPVSPTALFRIASSSKPITAVAIMKLVEDGKLGLEERAFEILGDLTPPPGTTRDPRLATITVRHLLEHSGGFDSTIFEPQFDGLRVAADAFGHPRPATSTDLIRYMMGQPLAFDPGSKYSYSNFGYNCLGRIIERKTKQSYGDHVIAAILRPAGVRTMSLMTRTSPSYRLPNEVFYADGDLSTTQWPIYQDDAHVRPISYGAFDGSAIDAHGGWIANTIDLTHFLNAVAGSTGVQLLAPPTVREMLTRPAIPQYAKTNKFYALGWDVSRDVVMSHNGALTFGTLSSVTRLPGGITFAAVFNHLDINYIATVIALERGSLAVSRGIKSWPTHDLYPTVSIT
ncbi:MAG: beta-lactamase family protein [Candidatus Eremiobacteraeota bacterium]|nr:beta-lactamase family protein [Candidatus Eremiobacteraeota bacterium]